MSVELEALVGHLFVVDGRPISTASPGAMASPPPRRAARGRDLDTFFGLITMGEGQRAPAALYEQLASLVSSKYFATSGSATSALREAIGAINAAVRSENASRTDPFDIGFVCAVLRENELIIAVSGPAHGFLAKGGERVERLPDVYDLAEPMVPLGREAEADIRFYRRVVQAEDFLILSDSGLAPLGEVTLREALGDGRVETTITSLRASAASFTSAVVIQFVAPLIAPPPPEEGAFQTACGAFSPNGNLFVFGRGDATLGLARNPLPPGQPPLRLEPPRPQPDGTARLAVTGDAGYQYFIQTSSNLTDWVPLTHGVTSTPAVQAIDPQAAAFPVRFYRAVTPP